MSAYGIQVLRLAAFTLISLPVCAGSASAEDCNANGIEDSEDIFAGTSQDCQPDGVPDECQLANNDCNNDNTPDECGVVISCETWEIQRLTPSDGNTNFFGMDVSANGTAAVVSSWAFNCPIGGPPCGAAYVYQLSGHEWVETARLTASDPLATHGIGGGAIHDNVVVVGNRLVDCPGAANCGAAYVFRFDGSDWHEEAKLSAPVPITDATFGSRLAVDDDIIVVGAYNELCSDGPSCGAVYIFRYNGSQWQFEERLAPADLQEGNFFGVSLDIRDDALIVGAPFFECPAGPGYCGAAYVFRFNGTSWEQEAKLIASDPDHDSRFGGSVDLDGNRAIVGAPSDGCGTVACGAAYMFEFNGSEWTEQAKLTSGEQFDLGRAFGRAVQLQGDRAMVSATESPGSPPQEPAAIYRFRLGGGVWSLAEKVTLPSGFQSDTGWSMAWGQESLIVGSPGLDAAFAIATNECEDCNENGVQDACDIANGVPDENGNGVPDECDDIVGVGDDRCYFGSTGTIACSISAGCPGGACGLKSRYITFHPHITAARSIQVEIIDMPLFPDRVGDVWWASGHVSVQNSPAPSVVGSTLQCLPTPFQPVTRIWDDSYLHLFGPIIIPQSTYSIRMCLADGTGCSATRFVSTGKWSDVVWPFGGSGQPNMADVAAIVDKFRNLSSAPSTPRTDQVGTGSAGSINIPNGSTNFSDVAACVDSFGGLPFPHTVPACP